MTLLSLIVFILFLGTGRLGIRYWYGSKLQKSIDRLDKAERKHREITQQS